MQNKRAIKPVAIAHMLCTKQNIPECYVTCCVCVSGCECTGKGQAAGDSAKRRGEAKRGENPCTQDQREDGTDQQW